jgi:tetratricopeptide (TPR) repeat protein
MTWNMPSTPSEAAQWLARADAAAADKNVPVDEVIPLYQKALALDPALVEGWADLAVCFAVLQRWDEAMSALARGLALDPRHRRCLLYRGDTLKRKGDKAGAVEAYRALVAAHADDAGAWVKYGTALDVAGRQQEALAAMERALAIRPRFIEAVNGKATVEAHMGRMPAGGIPLDVSPGEFMRQLMAAEVASVAQEMAAAAEERAAEEAARPPAPKEPDTPDACHARAQELAAAGDLGKALPYWEKALQLSPRHLPSLEAIVAALGKLGRPQDALAWSERWIAHPLQKERDRARALCAKGACLRQLREFVQALAAIDKALVLDPGNVGFAKERAATVAAARGAVTGTPAPATPSPAGPPGAQVFGMVLGADEPDPVAAVKKRIDQIAALAGPALPRGRMGGANPERFCALLTEAVQLNQSRRYAEALAKLAQAEQLDAQYADLHLAKGMNLRGLHRWEESVAALTRAVELDPSSKNAWFYLGDSLDNLDRLEHALACYERVVRLAPDDVDAWVDRGHVLNRMGKVLDAIDSWQRAVALDPACALAWLNKGMAEAALGKPADAIPSLERFLALRPTNELAQHTGRVEQVLGECRARLASSATGATSLQELFNRARLADREGRKVDAIEGYRAALAADAACFPAWVNLGVCLEEAGLHADALPCYEQALAINAKAAPVWGQKGLCLERLRRPDEALAALERAIALEPQNPLAWFNKGRMLLANRRPAEALEAAVEALDLNPAEAGAWRLKADALEELGRLPECLAALNRYAQLVPGDLHANNRRLEIQRRIAGTRKG